jgi:uncharacterized protein (DUF58 family)
MQLTRRAVLLLLIAAPLMAASTWFPTLGWATWIYLLLCLVLFGVDFRLTEPPGRIDITRHHSEKLNLGAENLVQLTLTNRGRRNLIFVLRDEPPDEFLVQKRVYAGTAAPRQTWQGRYAVMPLPRRG